MSAILVVYFLILLVHIFSQKNYGFHVVMGGSSGDRANSIHELHDGSGYITSGMTHFGGSGNGEDNILAMKLDLKGSIVWANSYGGDKYDYTWKIIQLKYQTGFIMAGETKSFSAGGDKDGLMIRLDDDGNVLWSRTISSSGSFDEYNSDIIETNEGGFLFSGCTSSVGNSDQFILKLSKDGFEEWSIKIGGSAEDYFIPYIIQTKDGGYAYGSTTRSYGSGGYNAVIYKFSSTGVKEWGAYYGGGSVDYGLGITELYEGGYILAGYNRNTNDYALLLKVTSTGDVTWSRRVGLPTTYGGRFLQYDADTYILSGYSRNSNTKIMLASIKASDGSVNWFKTLANSYLTLSNDGAYGYGFNIINNTVNNNGFIIGGYNWRYGGNPPYNITIIKTLPYPIICEHCEEEDVPLGSVTDTSLGYSKNSIGDAFGTISLILKNVTLNKTDVKSLFRVDYYCKTCDGIWATNSTFVCSGHGNCTAVEECSCEDGYPGKYCESVQCYGIESTYSSNVCSGNGICQANGECKCNSDFYGQYCNYTMCHGIMSNETSSVCYFGNGVCVAKDKCVCNPNYYSTVEGGICNVTKCENVFNNETQKVCNNGNGKCNFLDNCVNVIFITTVNFVRS